MVHFILNDKLIKTDLNKGVTLLDFIRYEQHLTGTKIGCREGDCAACGVLVGTLLKNETVTYQSMTSCITPLGAVHAKHIVTIEGINLPSELNILQAAMQDNYATQCGFCSPGFVMSLAGFALAKGDKTEVKAVDAIAGNICRCTGYHSIKKAAIEVSHKLNKIDSGINNLVDNGFLPTYFIKIPEQLKQIKSSTKNTVTGINVSGGTDLYVQRPDELATNEVHVLTVDPSLKGIQIDKDICTMGANTTVTDIWEHETLNHIYPNLRQLLKLVSSQPIRNMASIGGNIVNASPIGDMTAIFLAWESSLNIRNKEGETRQLALNDFYSGYKTYDLASDEIIKSIAFKLPPEGTLFNFEKVCKRTHLDIASVNTAIQIKVDNNYIKHLSLSIGGVAPIPLYLRQTVDYLQNKELSWEVLTKANEILQSEITPIGDVRGSINYKRLLARQLFFAHFTSLFPLKFTIAGYKQIA